MRKNSQKKIAYNIELQFLIIIIAVIIYIFFWSIIDILRLYSMQDSVFDSGIISLTMGSIFHYHYLPYITYMIAFSLLRIIFSPLILIDGITGMLVIQEIFLGLPAIVIYLIAKTHIKDKTSSLLISLSYLLYFPLAGVNYYDFHFQAFFMLFFLLGYFTFIKGKYLYSSIFFFLSGTVRFPYLAFPILFFLLLLVVQLYNSFQKRDHDKKIMNYALYNLLILVPLFSISYFILTRSAYYQDQNSYLGGYLHIHAGPILSNLELNITNKIITILLLLGPLLFIPIRNKKWILFTIPFLVILFYSNYNVYVYPNFYHFQYMVTIAPFLYLGLIYSITIESGSVLNNVSKTRIKKAIEKFYIELKKRKEPIGVLIAVILFAMVFQPYGPLNTSNSNPFDMNIFHPDITTYNEYREIANLIPNNNPYVIYQNNLPYIDVHDPSLSCLASFQTINGFNNNLSFILQNLTVTDNIDYALGYIIGFSGGSQLTMCQAMNKLYQKGDYGIEASKGGFILLTKNYNVAPMIYEPIQFNSTYSASFNKLNNSKISTYCDLIIPGTYSFNISYNNTGNNLIFNNYSIISFNYKEVNAKLKPKITQTNNRTYVSFTMKSNYFLYNPKIEIGYSGQESNLTLSIEMKENEPL
ncbi:multipass membrane protein [Cuniculiplasma divulgatum]|uniref:Multipass membrane protein n=2 Tax=Cuniculiplasma divulgatum TaxID=1673428 RepID=A0A1N5ULP0_9ARCH|nr:multipass membrane protein [Cuniculiplasma divulgatum]